MTRILLGFQLANRSGENIQGDEGDPTGLPSFHILSAEEAITAVTKHQDLGLLLMPIYEGDIEEPSFTEAVQLPVSAL